MPMAPQTIEDMADKAATLAGELTRLADKILDVTCDVKDAIEEAPALNPNRLPPNLGVLRDTVREWGRDAEKGSDLGRTTDLAQLEQVLTYLMTFEG